MPTTVRFNGNFWQMAVYITSCLFFSFQGNLKIRVKYNDLHWKRLLSGLWCPPVIRQMGES